MPELWSFLLVLLLLITPSTSASANSPGPRTGHCAVVSNNNLVLYGGSGQSGFSNFSSTPLPFQPNSTSWQPLDTTNAVIVNEPACAIMSDGSLLVVGGAPVDASQTAPAAFQTYDFNRNVWLSSDPGGAPNVALRGRTGIAMVPFVQQNMILVLGGQTDSQFFNDSWLFNYGNGVWTPLSSPIQATSHMAVAVSGDKGFLIGGTTQIGPTPDIWVFDISDSSFIKQDVALVTLTSTPQAAVVNEIVTVFSLETTDAYTQSFQVLSNATSRTSVIIAATPGTVRKAKRQDSDSVSYAPALRTNYAAVVDPTSNNILIVAGTSLANGQPLDDIVTFNPALERFTQTSDPNTDPPQSVLGQGSTQSPAPAPGTPSSGSTPASVPTISPSTSGTKTSTIPSGALIGIVVGVVIGVAALTLLLVLVIASRKRKAAAFKLQQSISYPYADTRAFANDNQDMSTQELGVDVTNSPYAFAQRLMNRVSGLFNMRISLPPVDITPFPDEKLRNTIYGSSAPSSPMPPLPAGMSHLQATGVMDNRASLSEFPMPPTKLSRPAAAQMRPPPPRRIATVRQASEYAESHHPSVYSQAPAIRMPSPPLDSPASGRPI